MAPPPLDTDVAIETPEHIVFRHRLGGPAGRAAAHLLDLLVCYAALSIVLIAIGIAVAAVGFFASSFEEFMEAFGGIALVLLFFVQWVYFALWEGLKGTTPGKMAFGMRVVTTSGRPIGFAAAALRNLVRTADFLPTAYLVGLTSMALTHRFQRLGDLVAGTMVIIFERPRAEAPIVLDPPLHPSELAQIPDVVQLDADERTAIELFLRRRRTLGPARAHELASMIGAPLAERLRASVSDPVRLLALVYDRAVNGGRTEGPVSSRGSHSIAPPSWRPPPPASRPWP